MATVVAKANGNWSATATWTGNAVPAIGDTVQTGNYAVTIDQDVYATLNPTGSGNFLVTAGPRVITGDVVMASTYTGGGVRCTHTTGVVQINGKVTGGSAAGAVALTNTSTGTCNVDTAVGGTGLGASGLHGVDPTGLTAYRHAIPGATGQQPTSGYCKLDVTGGIHAGSITVRRSDGEVLGTLPANDAWSAIAWNGSVFCAIASGDDEENPTVGCATSPDGIVWAQHSLPVAAIWKSIAWNGTVFCVVAGSDGLFGASAICATSPDGENWTQHALPAAMHWGGIAWNGSIFCVLAIGDASWNPAAICATSPNGEDWTQHALPATTGWRGIASNGTMFCATSYNSAICATSPDGEHWTQHVLPSTNCGQSIAWNGAVFCAISYNSNDCATSPDGENWELHSTLPAPMLWSSIAAIGGIFYVVAKWDIDYSPNTLVFISSDGKNWTQRKTPSTQNWMALSAGSDRLVALPLASTVSAILYSDIILTDDYPAPALVKSRTTYDLETQAGTLLVPVRNSQG